LFASEFMNTQFTGVSVKSPPWQIQMIFSKDFGRSSISIQDSAIVGSTKLNVDRFSNKTKYESWSSFLTVRNAKSFRSSLIGIWYIAARFQNALKFAKSVEPHYT
jgi:hypothetical protein